MTKYFPIQTRIKLYDKLILFKHLTSSKPKNRLGYVNLDVDKFWQ